MNTSIESRPPTPGPGLRARPRALPRAFTGILLGAVLATSTPVAVTSAAPAARLAPRPDSLSGLQAQELHFSTAQLLANDITAGAFPPPAVSLDSPPQYGTILQNGDTWTYRPNANFFGLDTFTYRLTTTLGTSALGTVEVLVVPFRSPLGVSPETPGGRDRVGYYNSASGVFYLCETGSAVAGRLQCSGHRYPGTGQGWLPLMGDWRGSWGSLDRAHPALFDPATREILWLDYAPAAPCADCPSGVHALALIGREAAGTTTRGTTAIPVVADLDSDGDDEIAWYDPVERTFLAPVKLKRTPSPTLPDERLWPFAAPQTLGGDVLGVYAPASGYRELLGGEALDVGELWRSSASLASGRRFGSGGAALEVYDQHGHLLSAVAPEWVFIDGECVPTGTLVLRFPDDPEPPPGGWIHSDPCGVPIGLRP